MEEAYDRGCLSRVPEKYVRLIREMSRDVRTLVRSRASVTDSSGVGVGLHQGSGLSLLLFNMYLIR